MTIFFILSFSTISFILFVIVAVEIAMLQCRLHCRDSKTLIICSHVDVPPHIHLKKKTHHYDWMRSIWHTHTETHTHIKHICYATSAPARSTEIFFFTLI